MDAAHILLHSLGKEGVERIHELEDLLKLDTSNEMSMKLLKLLCKSSSTPKEVKEEELLHRRKEVEVALLEFQRYFLH